MKMEMAVQSHMTGKVSLVAALFQFCLSINYLEQMELKTLFGRESAARAKNKALRIPIYLMLMAHPMFQN
jgi:hypothetical protein